MQLKLLNGGKAEQKDVRALEYAVGDRVSNVFLDFAKDNDGAEPETNIFAVSPKIDSGVNRFIPIKSIPVEMTFIENLPPKSFPIARAEGGNYIVMHNNGGVFFWDHEQPENFVKLADDFPSFLMLLKPFDITSIKLKPEQVKRVWVDPEFLKNLKE